VRCHGQQDDTRSSDADAYADKIGSADAKAIAKRHPKRGRYGTDKSIDDLQKAQQVMNKRKQKARVNCEEDHNHLANDQIAVRYAYMGTINEADVVQTHHSILQNKTCSRELEELPATNTVSERPG
jgi:hypothetical protein